MTKEPARFVIAVPFTQDGGTHQDEWHGHIIDAVGGECAMAETRTDDTSMTCLDGQVPGPGLWVAEGTITHTYSQSIPECEYDPAFEGTWRRPTPAESFRLARGERPLGAP